MKLKYLPRNFPKVFFKLIVCIFCVKLVFEHLFIKWYEEKMSTDDTRNFLELTVKAETYDERIFAAPPRNPEWEQLNNLTFFRRSAAYYFMDKRFLRAFFVTSAYNFQPFEITLLMFFKNNKLLKLRLKNPSEKKHDQWGKYKSNSLNYDLGFMESFEVDINGYIQKGDILKMSIIVTNPAQNLSTLQPINLKMKYLRSVEGKTFKKGSLICSKCYYYTNASSYLHFQWWFELNKQIGYDKITFCNSTIPNTPEHRQIFESYKDMIEVYQMQSLPNLLDKRALNETYNEYLTSFFDLKTNSHFDKTMTRVFDNLIFNECYLDNVDKYAYITIIDNDETIIPRINTEFVKLNGNYKFVTKFKSNQINDLENKCSNKMHKLEDYVTRFSESQNYINQSLYHRMSIYLKDRLVQRLIDTIEIHVKKIRTFHNDILINLIDYDPESEYNKTNNLTFVIKSKNDLQYAKNLCKLYNKLIKPFYEKYESEMARLSNRYNRFLFIAGASTIKKFGKTIHSTESTLQLIHHYPVETKYPIINYDFGHVSHFRDSYDINPKEPMNINELILDFNYFFCFFKPIFSKLSNKMVS